MCGAVQGGGVSKCSGARDHCDEPLVGKRGSVLPGNFKKVDSTQNSGYFLPLLFFTLTAY